MLEPEPVERLAVLGSERFRIAEREPAQQSRASAAALRERRRDPRAHPVQPRARTGGGRARHRERGMRQRAADGDPRAPEPPQRIAVAGIARPAQRREPQPRAQPIAGQPRSRSPGCVENTRTRAMPAPRTEPSSIQRGASAAERRTTTPSTTPSRGSPALAARASASRAACAWKPTASATDTAA